MLLSLATQLCLLRSHACQDELIFNDLADNRYSVVCVAGTFAFQVKTLTPRYSSPAYLQWITLTPDRPAIRLRPGGPGGRRAERALPVWARRGVGFNEEEDIAWGMDGFFGPSHYRYHDYRFIIQFGPTTPG